LIDWLHLQRLATALVMPLPLGLLIALFGLALLWRLRWVGALVIGLGMGLIGVCALPLVAGGLLGRLEAAYPPQAAEACPPADAIVVLGGAVQPHLSADVRARLHQGSDRVWEAAKLYHAGCAPLVVVSAGGKIVSPIVEVEAEAIAGLLVELGVPRAALRLERRSRNTLGNAYFSRALLASTGAKRVLLVTSAWHLRRAMALFERAGIEVVPMGADYRAFRSCHGLRCWVPSAQALELSGLAVKEYLGYLVQVRWRS
jgi:uncharacterized SAM-binding protein YcdF (DUF218 family)